MRCSVPAGSGSRCTQNDSAPEPRAGRAVLTGDFFMPRKLAGGLIQCSNPINDESQPVAKIKQAMFDKHAPLIEEAGRTGVQILCLQEIFNGPYFCPGQDKRWYDAAEPVPGPTTDAVAKLAAKYQMAV